MPREPLGIDVFNSAVDRMVQLYEAGHRVVVSFSAGKDSTCVLEVCILAARLTGRLPVEVVMRDEEIAFPGTYEYAIRTARRPEVSFNWLIANQPVINVYNRANPYFWVYDPQLPPDKWVYHPPVDDPDCNVTFINELNIESMTIPERFPPDPGKTLIAAIGLRVQESRGRLYGLFSSGGYLTGASKRGVRNARPIYDWRDGDVWKAIRDNGWDYNSAYNGMMQMGMKRSALRIAPPTMNAAGIGTLGIASKLWPAWFDKVCERLPGVRTAAMFGKRSVTPMRRYKETWQECFERECLGPKTPPWIVARAERARDFMLSTHAHHSTTPFPEVQPCYHCSGNLGSWRSLCLAAYSGDPFSVKLTMLPNVEPEFFREGAGYWGGKPSW